MSGAASLSHIAGYPQLAGWAGADDTEKVRTGTIINEVDKVWGGRELIYCYAAGTIAQFAAVAITPTWQTTAMRIEADQVPNTANLGKPVGVALTSATAGQYFWAIVSGMTPIKSGASVSADTAFGITAAGTVGAIANGKQILNARSILAATQTVAKAGCTAKNGSYTLQVPNAAGWFVGAYLSGTGIASGAYVTAISKNGREVTMSAVTTAVVAGTVTATYNNSTIYYNVAYLNRPFAQGQVT